MTARSGHTLNLKKGIVEQIKGIHVCDEFYVNVSEFVCEWVAT